MSRRRAKTESSGERNRFEQSQEWVGGRISPPFFVAGGTDRPFRIEIVLWLELPVGIVVGQEAVAPAESQGALGRVLLDAMERPLVGAARRPERIRVASPSLAAEVRAAVGDTIPLEIAPTPELDDLTQQMIESMPPPDEEESYFEAGRVPPEAVEQLFVAAALLYGAAPWEVADDSQVLRLDIPELDVQGACVSIIGQLGESLGLLIFPSLDAYEDFLLAAEEFPHGDGPGDLGTDFLALSFERGADLPRGMRREVAEHGWPVADARAYPCVDARESDGVSRPLTEREVRIASSCAATLVAFFRKNRGVFEEEVFEPVCESYTDDHGLTVRFTAPYEALLLFDVDNVRVTVHSASTAKRGPKVGRNDPCPCGSGKKYKKCHLEADRERARFGSGVAALHDLDRELAARMGEFASRRFGAEWWCAEEDFLDAGEAMQLAMHWALYHFLVQGRPVFEWYLEERVGRLAAASRQWLAAQSEAWLSVWEVIEVHPGESLTLRDQLSHEVRLVHEILGSRTLLPRDAVLARVVEHGEVSLLCGLHPHILPPTEAGEVVRRARSRLRRKRAVPVERLRDEKLGRYLIARWEEAVDDLELSRVLLLQLDGARGSEFPAPSAVLPEPEQLALDFKEERGDS